MLQDRMVWGLETVHNHRRRATANQSFVSYRMPHLDRLRRCLDVRLLIRADVQLAEGYLHLHA